MYDTVFTPSISIPYLFLILNIYFSAWLCVWRIDRQIANSVDPDQMPQYVASDLGLHCLLRLIG